MSGIVVATKTLRHKVILKIRNSNIEIRDKFKYQNLKIKMTYKNAKIQDEKNPLSLEKERVKFYLSSRDGIGERNLKSKTKRQNKFITGAEPAEGATM
jgi:hypothetical protein